MNYVVIFILQFISNQAMFYQVDFKIQNIDFLV
jgi:hypothetical protein